MISTNLISEAEKTLFIALGEEWLLPLVESGSIIAPKAYEMAALNAFLENRQGPAEKALRRAIRACHRADPYRMTPEFDALCTFKHD